MPDADIEDPTLVALCRALDLIAAAISWHDNAGEHRWCPGCDVVAVLKGETP